MGATNTFHNNPWKLTTRETYILMLHTEYTQKKVCLVANIGRPTVYRHWSIAKRKMRAKSLVHACILLDRWWQEVRRTAPSYTLEALDRQLLESGKPNNKPKEQSK